MGVSAVIPAFNEERYIDGVLAPLAKINALTEIIVVSDGSKDNTVGKAVKWNVNVIELTHNIGKGGAMAIGLKHVKNDVVLFLDADLIGLKESHILNLINPVLEDEADMTIGVFESGRVSTDMAQFIAPFLSGQRCIKKCCLKDIEEWVQKGFGIEVALTKYAYENRLRVQQINLPEMTHVMKEEKLGLVKGFAYRMKMYWEIAKNVRIGG